MRQAFSKKNKRPPVCSVHGKKCQASLHSHTIRPPFKFVCNEACNVGACRAKE